MSHQDRIQENIKSLITVLESKDGKERKKARLSLIAKGRTAVPFLINTLQHSKVIKARWESAKAFGVIYDIRAIPALVNALDDSASDVAWLAAKALQRYGKCAWKELLGTLIKRGAESDKLRRGTHHVLRNQKEDGYNELLANLKKSLTVGMARESASLYAYKILEKIREQEENCEIIDKSVDVENIES